MIMSEKQTAAVERKQRICDRYKGADTAEVEVIARAELLEQRHYAGNWDVLRPATELKEYNLFMAEDMRGMLHEAERIMEGWLSADA